MTQPPVDIIHLARMLDDEDEDVAVNVIAALLEREDEISPLLAMLQESDNLLVRRRVHQMQAAISFRRRRREFFKRINGVEPDFCEGIIDLHMLWFDKDKEQNVRSRLDNFAREARRRELDSLSDAAYLMRRSGIAAETETVIRPENYCIGTILDQRCGSGALLIGLLNHLFSEKKFRIVRTLDEFALYDGEQNSILLGCGGWRVCPAPDVTNMEFWENRSLLRFAAAMLFSGAVTTDSFRYVLTIGQALSGEEGDAVLENLPYPYRPEK